MQRVSGLKKLLAVCLLAASVASCAAVSGQETAGEYVDDATITTKVKSAMVEDPSLRNKIGQIHVETMKDVVQLSGFVDSAQTSARAEEVARGVKGVRGVRNDLIVQ